MEKDDLTIDVDGGSSEEDKNRRMETNISLEINPTPELEQTTRTGNHSPTQELEQTTRTGNHSPTQELEQTTRIGNHAEDDEARSGMDLSLYEAAKQSDVGKFINVLEKVANEKGLTHSAIFNHASPIGNTYLHVAASSDNREIVSWIARHSPTSMGKKNFNGDTALHLAARAGHWHTTEILLLMWKIRDLPSVEEEIQQAHREENLLLMRNEKGNTALHEALMNSQDETACHLIKEDPKGAFYPNNKLESPLSLSAKIGSEKCVSLILSFEEELGREIEQVKAGKSPVHEAINSRNKDVMKVVFSKVPSSLHFTDEEGRFPLHYAASMGYIEEVGYLLDEFSADAFERDKNGLLPVHWASDKGNVSVIQKLLLYCPHPEELLDQNGSNILHFVAKSGRYIAIRRLLKEPAFESLINMKDKQGNTPLHLAAMHFKHKSVNRLIWDSRVNVMLLNDQGMTALDAAVAKIMGDASTMRQRFTLASLRAAGVPQVYPKNRTTINLQTGNTMDEIKSENYNVNQQMGKTTGAIHNRINTLLLVAILVATVTFAAGFTVPGGYNNSNPDQGMATLLHQRKFQLFIICDTIAMYSSILAVVGLFNAQLDLWGLKSAFYLLSIALAMMSLAFMAGVSVVVSKLKWLDNTIFSMEVTFLSVLSVVFFQLCFPVIFSRRLGYVYYSPFILPMYVAKAIQKTAMGE